MPTTLEVVATDERHTHVRIAGPLDLAGVQEVELRLTAHTASRRRPSIVDVSGVPLIASLGMGMLLRIARALAASDVRLVLLAPSPAVAGALRTARLDLAMPIADDLDAAHALAGTAAGKGA